MDLKDKKICFIIDDSNIIIFNKVMTKIKELKKLKADINIIIQSKTKNNTVNTIEEYKNIDLIVIAPCSRELC